MLCAGFTRLLCAVKHDPRRRAHVLARTVGAAQGQVLPSFSSSGARWNCSRRPPDP